VTRRSTIGDRAFPVAAARAWNSLPSFVTSSSSLLTFKRHLKTYLFATSYWWCCWPSCFFLCLPNMSSFLMCYVSLQFFWLNATLIISLIIIIIIIIKVEGWVNLSDCYILRWFTHSQFTHPSANRAQSNFVDQDQGIMVPQAELPTVHSVIKKKTNARNQT